MDLTREVVFRNYTLNDASLHDDMVAGEPLAGCVLDSADYSDVDVTQFIEKRSQQDGMDAGDVFLGTRRLRVGGTVYGLNRADLYDRLWALRAALSPVLSQREEPMDRGYRPMYFSVPTNDPDYSGEGGIIQLQIKAMPRAFSASFMRDVNGGEDEDALAIPWQATFVCKDPSIMSASPYAMTMLGNSVVTATNATYSDNYINGTHALSNGDRIRFTTLTTTTGTGLNTTTNYYVVQATTGKFKVSTSSGGGEVGIATANYTVVKYVKSLTLSGTLNNRGTYMCPVNALFLWGLSSGTISGTIGDATFTISVPASTNGRIIRFKGEDKVLSVEEVDPNDPAVTRVAEVVRMDLVTLPNMTNWPLISPGANQSWSITAHGEMAPSGSNWWFYERYA